MNLCPPGCLCLVHPLCIVWWKPGCPCMAVCLCPSHLISVVTQCIRMCTYISTWTYVYLTPHVWSTSLWIVTWNVGCPCVSLHVCVPVTLFLFLHLVYNVYMHQYINLCPPGCLYLVHPLCIVWWKSGCPCMAVCFCPSHLISVATPCLECVHASVHEFMSTWMLMSGPPRMHGLMETWVPLYGSLFVS